MPFQAGLILPSGVRKPMFFRVVARRPLGNLRVLQQQPVFEDVKRALHAPVVGREKPRGAHQRLRRLDRVPVQSADVGAAARPPPTPRAGREARERNTRKE